MEWNGRTEDEMSVSGDLTWQGNMTWCIIFMDSRVPINFIIVIRLFIHAWRLFIYISWLLLIITPCLLYKHTFFCWWPLCLLVMIKWTKIAKYSMILWDFVEYNQNIAIFISLNTYFQILGTIRPKLLKFLNTGNIEMTR